MLALVAALCFLLALFKVDIGDDINFVTVGLFFIALHLAFPIGTKRLTRR